MPLPASDGYADLRSARMGSSIAESSGAVSRAMGLGATACSDCIMARWFYPRICGISMGSQLGRAASPSLHTVQIPSRLGTLERGPAGQRRRLRRTEGGGIGTGMLDVALAVGAVKTSWVTLAGLWPWSASGPVSRTRQMS